MFRFADSRVSEIPKNRHLTHLSTYNQCSQSFLSSYIKFLHIGISRKSNPYAYVITESESIHTLQVEEFYLDPKNSMSDSRDLSSEYMRNFISHRRLVQKPILFGIFIARTH